MHLAVFPLHKPDIPSVSMMLLAICIVDDAFVVPVPPVEAVEVTKGTCLGRTARAHPWSHTAVDVTLMVSTVVAFETAVVGITI